MRRSALLQALLLFSLSVARADEAEGKAVALVKKLGGAVMRDEKKPGKPVVHVDLSRTKISDAAVKELATFKQLQKLDLERAGSVRYGA